MPAVVKPSECERPPGLIECDLVLDVGPGLRPVEWYTAKHHVCIEPCPGYAVKLREAGYKVIEDRALESLRRLGPEDDRAIYMLDVIEHMTWSEGEQVVTAALALNPKQMVIFTPFGFLPQHGDVWGLGGEHWQEHRSGWLPEDFPGWAITKIHQKGNAQHPGHDMFFAVWTRP